MIAPSLGLVGLLVCLVLTVVNFPTLISGSPGIAVVIGAVLVGSFVAGVVLSAVLRPVPGAVLAREAV